MKDSQNQPINWFPGHMKKATDEIANIIKSVDLVLEVVDARCINSSSNEELLTIVKPKPVLKIALKADLADLNRLKDNYNKEPILIGSLKDKDFKKQIIGKMHLMMAEKTSKYLKKGLVIPKYLVLVVGLPNVGKSSLINFLQSKKRLKVENRPGVTKNQSISVIDQNFNLIDTPGILFKKIHDLQTAYKLCLINCIKKEVFNLEDVLKFAFLKIQNQKNFEKLFFFYKTEQTYDFYEFANFVCSKYQFILNQNEYDYERFYNLFYNDLSLAKIFKINWD